MTPGKQERQNNKERKMDRDTINKKWWRMEWMNASKGRKSDLRYRRIQRLQRIATDPVHAPRAIDILAEFADSSTGCTVG
jgi:hypothetical protein